MSVRWKTKIPSLEITVLHRYAKEPHDVEQWSSGRNPLSATYTQVRFLYPYMWSYSGGNYLPVGTGRYK